MLVYIASMMRQASVVAMMGDPFMVEGAFPLCGEVRRFYMERVLIAR